MALELAEVGEISSEYLSTSVVKAFNCIQARHRMNIRRLKAKIVLMVF